MEDGKEESINNVHFLKTDPKARYQGYTFFFREGFCWNNVLNPKARLLKAKLKLASVLSMSLFTMTELPDWYYVSLINSEFISLYVDNFINNTSHFQINDARQLPIIIPLPHEFEIFKEISEASIVAKKASFSSAISTDMVKEKLNDKQAELDKAVLKLYSI